MTAEERAATMASKANECCHRGEDYEDDLAAFFLAQVEAAILEEREACARIAEDMFLATDTDSYGGRFPIRGIKATAAQRIAESIRKRTTP